MDIKKQRRTLTEIAEGIAKNLIRARVKKPQGGGDVEIIYFYDVDPEKVDVKDAPGIVLHRRGGSDRIEVTGKYPWNPVLNCTEYPPVRFGGRGRPLITIGAGRKPEELASDIARRFLPKYGPVFTECLKQVQEYDSRQQQCQALAKKLGELTGRKVIGDDSLRPRINVYKEDDVYGDIDVSSDSCVRFNITVGGPLAKKIARLLK